MSSHHFGHDERTSANVRRATLPFVEPIEAFIREDEATEFLRVSPRTLQRWRADPPRGGGPPWYKAGAAILYRRSELVEWVRSRQGGRAA